MPIYDGIRPQFGRRRRPATSFGLPGATGWAGFQTPGNLTIPGQSWQQLIAADPGYQQFQAGWTEKLGQGAASRAAGLRDALIRLGIVPNINLTGLGLPADAASWLAEDIDEATKAAAAANETSAMAMTEKEHQENLLYLQDLLASRGQFRSGATGKAIADENLATAKKRSDLVQGLLDTLKALYGTGEGGYAGLVGQSVDELGAFGREVKDNLIKQGVSPREAQTAVFNQETNLWYVGGQYYDAQGNPVKPPAYEQQAAYGYRP